MFNVTCLSARALALAPAPIMDISDSASQPWSHRQFQIPSNLQPDGYCMAWMNEHLTFDVKEFLHYIEKKLKRKEKILLYC